jgi:ribonuclease HI
MLIAYIDGGSRGNPGPAGYGVQIKDTDGLVLANIAESIGTTTNNVAEYRAFLAALYWALEHKQTRLHICSDSELLVKQLSGEYKVKSDKLKPLYQEVVDLVAELDITIEHIPREQNKEADLLANMGMDKND